MKMKLFKPTLTLLAYVSFIYSQVLPPNSDIDYTNAQEIQTLSNHEDYVSSLLKVSDNLIASASEDRNIKIWKQESGQFREIQTLTGHTKGAWTLLKVSENVIASGSDDKTIRLWKQDNGQFKESQKLTGHTNGINCLLKVSENITASGSDDKNIKLWKQEGDQFKELQTLTGHTSGVYALLKVSENVIASGSWDKTIKLWKQENGEFNEAQTLTSHSKPVKSLLKVSENVIASGSEDGFIKFWRNNNGTFEEIQSLTSNSGSVESLLKVSENVIASGTGDGNILLLREQNGRFEMIKKLSGHSKDVLSLLKVSENVMASGSRDKTIKLWRFSDLNKEKQIGDYKLKIHRKSGKITLMYSGNSTNSTESSRIELDFDSLVEKNATGIEVGKSGVRKHSFKNFSQLDFDIREFKESKFQNLSVLETALDVEDLFQSTKFTAYVFIFNEAGIIDSGANNKISVSKGSLKLIVKIQGWIFCSNNTNNAEVKCIQDQTAEVGSFVDFTVRIKGKNSAILADSKKNQYSFGDANIYVPNDIRLDVINAKMPEGFPAFASDNSTNLFSFRFPKFERSVEYELIVELAQPNSGSNTFLIVLLVILGLVVVGFGAYCICFRKRADQLRSSLI